RRAVCGDLTSCFDFKTPNAAVAALPATAETAQRAKALPGRTKPPTPAEPMTPVQATGVRRSRPLPYALDVALTTNTPRITFRNTGSATAVLHVYDCKRLDAPPRRYTVEPGKMLQDDWAPAADGSYDLFVQGPNGFHRRFASAKTGAGPLVTLVAVGRKVQLRLNNPEKTPRSIRVTSEPYAKDLKGWASKLAANGAANELWDLSPTSGWYDLTVRVDGLTGWSQRFAGRLDTGVATMTDPALGGPAIMNWA
ncbi:MAG: DUF756 domain-containing protein, partial [Burkholderiales bacterium]